MNLIMFKKISILFFASIIIHLALSISFANRVYQECDSDQVYSILTNYPQSVRDYTSWGYDPSPKSQLYKSLRLNYLDSVQNISLPGPVRSALALGWGSTYSPGVGFIYGLVWWNGINFKTFMQNAIIINILVVHICSILLYSALKNFGYKQQVYYSIPLLYLFSWSIYSYQFHLGSTIWNINTGIIFLYIYSIYTEKSNYKNEKIMPLTCSILLFFSYLTVVYWIAYFIVDGIKILFTRDKLEKYYILIKNNIIFILSLLVILIYFYQPDQGARGHLADGNIGSGIFYLILNFFSLYNDNNVLNFIQFNIIVVVLAVGIIGTFLNIIKGDSKLKIINLFILVFTFIYYIFLVWDKLSIAPSRHILFLLPLLYLLCANTIDLIKINLKIYKPVYLIVFSILIYSNFLRGSQLQNELINLSVIDFQKNYTSVLIKDCSISLWNSDYLKGANVNGLNPSQKLDSGTYLYLSQAKDLDKNDFKTNLITDSNIRKILIKGSNRTFLPHSPYNYPHDRPNNLYAYEIVISK